MKPCCSDAVFYRVFCVTLLTITLMFAVILTNVFVDIDHLIWAKDNNTMEVNKEQTPNRHSGDMLFDIAPSADNEDNYVDDIDETGYRRKRSLESQNILFHIKSPKVKNILTNRLVDLLEELDAEETSKSISKGKQGDNAKPKDVELLENVDKIKGDQKIQKIGKKDRENSDDMLHLAMHNILLQGILGHMDLNKVYKKVHSLVRKFDDSDQNVKEKITSEDQVTKRTSKESKPPMEPESEQENQFFEELMKCKTLEKEINEKQAENVFRKTKVGESNQESKIFIKTIIDITTKDDEDKKPSNDTSNHENIKGVVKLIYNGKPVKFDNIDDKIQFDETLKSKMENTLNTRRESDNVIKEKVKNIEPSGLVVEKYRSNQKINPKSYLDQIVNDYFQKYKNFDNFDTTAEVTRKFVNKRLKRHVRVRYDNNGGVKHKRQLKKDDDELYVEIETHFNNKGLNGEKKKKLVKNIIEKIKNAIHSGIDNNKVHKKVHIVKRTREQPNKNVTAFVDKFLIPYYSVSPRELKAISKSNPEMDPVPLVSEKDGGNWQQISHGPGYFGPSKSINSAETGAVNVEYDKIMKVNGIPQRLQQPINTNVHDELNEENTNGETVFDAGNLRFYIKNIEGTGLSIAFNQFVDEPPDVESLKAFSSLENLVENYRQGSDDTNTDIEKEKLSELSKFDNDNLNDSHLIKRRSVPENKNYYNSQDYVHAIYENRNFLPFKSYQDIYNSKKNDSSTEDDSKNKYSLIIDDTTFNKKMSPSEIFNIASIIDRQKRSVKLNRYSDIKTKKKLIKFINTKTMSGKRILYKSKRNKRDIEKIRIIATDSLSDIPRSSSENIYIDDNVFNDKSIVREVETPELIETRSKDDRYDYIYPYAADEEPSTSYHLFGEKSRHNALMSKYPHIFMEDVIKSKEQDPSYNPMLFAKIVENESRQNNRKERDMSSENISTLKVPAPKIHDLLSAITPQLPKTNYKLSVKIFPKNASDLNTGYKEIHTSINKTYNNNGLTYSSLVNVSELTKIEKLNTSRDNNISTASPIMEHIKKQQKTMHKLLKEHKESIDKHLDYLKNDKFQKDNRNSDDEYVDLVLPLDPPQKLHLRKDDVSNIISTALINIKLNNTANSNVKETVKAKSNGVQEDSPRKEPLYYKIIDTIKKNENLTNEILMKIDKNTEMLKVFLEKIVNKVYLGADINRNTMTEKDNSFRGNMNFNVPKDWNNNSQMAHELFLRQTLPNMNLHRNISHIPIPFVYAYQQPYALDNKAQNLMASIVYHGHVHANTLKPRIKDIKSDTKPNVVQNKGKNSTNPTGNLSRFFIDDLDSGFKIETVGDLNALMSSKTGHNTTSI